MLLCFAVYTESRVRVSSAAPVLGLRFPRGSAMPLRSSAGGQPPVAEFPLIPSQAQKLQQKRQKEQAAYYEAQIAELEEEHQSLQTRCAAAEERCTALEHQREESEQSFEEQFDAIKMESDARIKALEDTLRMREKEVAREALRQKEARSALESKQSALVARVAALNARLQQYEVQVPTLQGTISSLEAKLAQAEAERRGVEALAEQVRSGRRPPAAFAVVFVWPLRSRWPSCGRATAVRSRTPCRLPIALLPSPFPPRMASDRRMHTCACPCTHAHIRMPHAHMHTCTHAHVRRASVRRSRCSACRWRA